MHIQIPEMAHPMKEQQKLQEPSFIDEVQTQVERERYCKIA